MEKENRYETAEGLRRRARGLRILIRAYGAAEVALGSWGALINAQNLIYKALQEGESHYEIPIALAYTALISISALLIVDGSYSVIKGKMPFFPFRFINHIHKKMGGSDSDFPFSEPFPEASELEKKAEEMEK